MKLQCMVIFIMYVASVTSLQAMYLRGSYEGFVHKWLRAYYATIQDIAAYLGGEIDSELDPRFNQIVANGGIALYMCHKVPLYFGTPLGRVRFIDCVPDDEQFRKAQDILGLIEMLPCINNTWGPVYAITKDITGCSLPNPIMPYPFNVVKFAFLRIGNNKNWAFITLDEQHRPININDVLFEPLSRSEAFDFWAVVKPDWQLDALLNWP